MGRRASGLRSVDRLDTILIAHGPLITLPPLHTHTHTQRTQAIAYSGNAYSLRETQSEQTVKIFYDRAYRKLFVYLNDLDTPILDAWVCAPVALTTTLPTGEAAGDKCIDIDGIADAGGEAWVGFTGSAGQGGLNDYRAGHKVSDFDFKTARTEASLSFVQENGTAVALAGEPGTFTIDSRDSCGFPRRTGVGYRWFVELRNRDAAMAATTLLPREVADAGNGEFKCTWTPAEVGAFEASSSGELEHDARSRCAILPKCYLRVFECAILPKCYRNSTTVSKWGDPPNDVVPPIRLLCVATFA